MFLLTFRNMLKICSQVRPLTQKASTSGISHEKRKESVSVVDNSKKKVKSFEKNRQIKRIKKFLPTLSKLGIMKL